MSGSGAYLAEVSKESRPTTPGLSLRILAPDGSQRVVPFAGGDRLAAQQHAASRGWRVLSIDSQGMPAAKASSRGERFALSLFNHELLALLEAGLNLNEAMQTLHAKERQPGTARGAEGDARASAGRKELFGRAGGLARALSGRVRGHRPGVRTHRRSAACAARYLDYQLQFETIRKKVVSAAIYPVLLLVVGGLRDVVSAWLRRATLLGDLRVVRARAALAVGAAVAVREPGLPKRRPGGPGNRVDSWSRCQWA